MNKLGVIGGTGLYQLDELSNVEKIVIDTPYGQTSSEIYSGTAISLQRLDKNGSYTNRNFDQEHDDQFSFTVGAGVYSVGVTLCKFVAPLNQKDCTPFY